MFIYTTIFIIILLLGLYIIFFYSSGKKLTTNRKSYYKKLINEITKKDISNKEKIITFDKIYHNILTEVGYKGTFGDILKKKPIVIKDLNKIWELHKLRNKLVHEIEFSDEKLLERQTKNYFSEIEKLLNNLK